MAVWSVIGKREVQEWHRLDAEFWRPEHGKTHNVVSGWSNVYSLGDIAKRMRKGIFDILAEEYVEQGVPFLRVSNVSSILLDTSDLAYISEERNRQDKKTCFGRGDIVLNKTGDIGAAVVSLACCNISQDLIGLEVADKGKFNPYYITAFLNSNYGRLQLQRWFQGQVQMHLALTDARKILVPFPRLGDQHDIELTVLSAIGEAKRAETLYLEAEGMMLEEIGWGRLDPSQPKWWTVPLKGAREASRLDAEYFQPRHQLAIALMGKSGMRLKDVAKLAKRAFKPVPGAPFRYIEIANLTADGFANTETVMGEDAPSRAAWTVRANDVITSTVRPIRRLSAIIEPQQGGSVCSSGFAVLEPNGIQPEVLLAYLRLPVVCGILDLWTKASMYPAMSVTDLLAMPITLPPEEACHQVAAKVAAARQAHRKGRRLLDEAVARVERLIEGEARCEG